MTLMTQIYAYIYIDIDRAVGQTESAVQKLTSKLTTTGKSNLSHKTATKIGD